MRRQTIRSGLLVPMVFSMFVLSVMPVSAQDTKKAPPSLHQDAERMITDLQARGERLRDLQEKVQSNEGERRAIFRNELLRRWDGFAAELDKLVQNLEKQKEKGIEHAEQREVARALTVAVAGGLADAALARDHSLAGLEDKRAAATGDEQAALLREVRRESAIYRNLLKSIVDNIERMKLLGVDTSAEGEQIDRLLEERAQVLEGRLRLALVQRSEAKELLRGAVEADKAALRKEMSDASERLTFSAEGLRSILDQMERRGLPTAERRELLLKATGELGTGVLDTKVAVGLLQSWVSEARIWVRENGPRVTFRLLVAFLIISTFWLLSRMVARVVRVWVRSSRLEMSVLLQEFFVMLGSRSVQMIGLLVALSQLGINLAPLLAGLGIAGFVIGFALQDTLSNFASGMMILVYHPYDVADAVEVAGVLGVVSEMNLVSTTIKTFDNQKLIVPNSKIWGDVIRNLTAEDTRRVDLVFGISYGDDIAKAERLFEEEAGKHELVLKEPAPVIKVSALGDSSVNFIVRPWVKTADYWTVYWDLTRNIKLRLDAEGITIPFPQRDVHIFKSGE